MIGQTGYDLGFDPGFVVGISVAIMRSGVPLDALQDESGEPFTLEGSNEYITLEQA